MTRRLEPVSAHAPSAWASYLINGDGSGLEADETDKAEAFADWLCGRPWSLGMIASCEPAGFMRNHDATRFGALAADCERYTALIPTDAQGNRL
jgi:hypothetical protein